MSIKLCIADVQAAAERAGQRLLDEEVNDILDIMNDQVERLNPQALGESLIDTLYDTGTTIARNAKRQAALAKRNTMINAKKYIELKARIIDSDDPSKELIALLVGSLDEQKKNGGFSIDAQQKAAQRANLQTLAVELEKDGLVEIFQSRQLDELIYRELFDGFGVTGNKEAKMIAEAIRRTQKIVVGRKNRAGADIDELAEYVVRQNHDAGLLRDAGFDKWKADILELIDAERTFKDLLPGQSQDDYLLRIYNNIVSGKHTRADVTSDPVAGFKGASNLAKKLSEERIIHFKDGKSSYKYAQLYSRSPLAEAVVNGLLHDGQNIGLLENLGTNPKMMLDRLMEEAADKAAEQGKPFRKNLLDIYYKELDGTTMVTGATTGRFMGTDFAGVASAYRKIQQMATLGAATISSISDVATKAATINRITDRNIFQSYHQALKDTFSTMNKRERKQVGYRLLTFTENFIGDTHARFGADDSGPGMISSLNRLFFKLNGMTWWNNAQKTGLARMLATDLAEYAPKGWANLPDKQKQILGFFSISESEFNLFRNIEMRGADGRNYLFPDLAYQLTDAQIDPIISIQENTTVISPAMREQFKDKLSAKLGAYYTDMADAAVPTPGARERAFMNLGTMRGTVLGETLRAIMQLKGFPITYITKSAMRQFKTAGGGMSGSMALAGTMVGTTIMGYMAMSLKDILRGREPKDPTSTATFTAAFVQGGGAGILGDFIFGEFNRYGRSPLESLAGPTLGTASDLLKLYARLRDGEDGAALSVRSALNNMPFINLFYTRAAMEYLFIYGVLEHNSPGYLRRMERRLEKDTGQEYFFPPSQYATRL
jgi:hypothetical protein